MTISWPWLKQRNEGFYTTSLPNCIFILRVGSEVGEDSGSMLGGFIQSTEACPGPKELDEWSDAPLKANCV